LEEGVEGIIPISEMSNQRINTPEDVLSVGQEIEARIKQVQINQRRITLSLKAAVQERETRETRSQVRQINERVVEEEGVRLGDVFGQQLRAARERGRERNEARDTARQRALQAAAEEEDDWTEDADVEAVDIEAADTIDATVEPVGDENVDDEEVQ
jgi:ribosomal protein S1